MDVRKNLGHHKAPQQRSTEDSSLEGYQDSAVEKEIKQRAATALHDHSALLLHALSMNETPAKARLRMYRHLTGQPQPLHDYTPAKRKHKESENTYASGSNNPNVTGMSSSSRAAGSSSSSSSAAQGQSTSRPRRDIIPVDEEFAQTYFQGPLSS